MSGWIKVEKSLNDDPRVRRMASRLRNADVTLGEKSSALVIGALVRLWCYADTHIRNDDTLDLGKAEIDDIVGLPGFCDLMPDDWLRILDDSTVELPGFQAHNGVEAKRRALGQKRASRHRDKSNARSVTPPSRPALPDQTRPDQTIQKTPSSSSGARDARPSRRCPADFELTEQLRAISAELPTDFDLDAETAKFRDFEFQKPRKDWPACWRTWMRNARDRNTYARKRVRLRTLEEIEADEARRAAS